MKSDKLPLILGGLTFLLFAATPYALDLIEPSKSLGRIVGENVRDIMDTMNGNETVERPSTKRDIWLNIFRVISFLLFALTLLFALKAFQNDKKWIGISGVLLALLGIGIYLTQLAVGLVVLVIILIASVIIYLFIDSA